MAGRHAAGAVRSEPRLPATGPAVRQGHGVMSRNLLVRIAFAVPAIAGTLVVLRLGGWVLAALLACLGVLGTRELYHVARRQGVEPLDGLGYAAAAVIPFATVWARGSPERSAAPAIFGGALWLPVVPTAAALARGPPRRALWPRRRAMTPSRCSSARPGSRTPPRSSPVTVACSTGSIRCTSWSR